MGEEMRVPHEILTVLGLVMWMVPHRVSEL